MSQTIYRVHHLLKNKYRSFPLCIEIKIIITKCRFIKYRLPTNTTIQYIQYTVCFYNEEININWYRIVNHRYRRQLKLVAHNNKSIQLIIITKLL